MFVIMLARLRFVQCSVMVELLDKFTKEKVTSSSSVFFYPCTYEPNIGFKFEEPRGIVLMRKYGMVWQKLT